MNFTKHGANLFELSKELNLDIDDFKDFSSNINPFGASKKALEKLSQNLDKVSIYPDPEYKELKSSISSYCECNSKNILLGSGASSFISAFIKLLPTSKSLILSPAYSEYKKELEKVNSNIHSYKLSEDDDFRISLEDFVSYINANTIDTTIICNPNNPTGTILTRDEIKYILDNTKTNLIIDETYIEFTDTNIFSSTPLCEHYDNLYVIRGTSKFFACPGIRLGYAITSNLSIKNNFEKYFNILWDINIFADILGQVMFLDKEYQISTFKNIDKQRKYIYESISNISSLKIYNSYGNFFLVKINDDSIISKKLYDFLLDKKFIIRDCSNFEALGNKYFRICVLTEEYNKKIIEYLLEFFN